MTKISVIVPIYEAEKYLRQCLDSLLAQTLKDIEIICINDGSTDDSLKILEEYAKIDSRIKIFSKKNEGAGAARNLGLKYSNGDYIIFFDSDDYMKNTALEKLYNNAQKTGADIVICNTEFINQDTGEKQKRDVIKKDLLANKKVFSPQEISPHIFQFCVGWPWDKLYKASFIKETKLQFQNLRHSNDIFFVLFSLILSNLISIEDDILITHRYHNKSLEATRIKKPECFYLALKKIFIELKKTKNYLIYEQSFVNYCISFSTWHITSIKDKNAEKLMLKFFRKIAKMIKLNKYKDEYFYDLKMKEDLCYSAFHNIILRNIYFIKYFFTKKEKDLIKACGTRIHAKLYTILKKQNEKTILWGASLFLKDFLEKNRINNKNILGIIDINPDRKGEKFCNYTIYSPEQIIELKPKYLLLTIKNNNEQKYLDVKKFLAEKKLNTVLMPNVFEGDSIYE